MRKLLLVLALLPTILLAQSSWVNIQYLSDNYPTENSWELLNSTGAVVLESDSNYVANTLLDTTITLDPGTYTFNLYDIYGDGLGGSQWGGTDGWFLIHNDCQDTLTFVAGDFGSLYIDTLTIAPCAPPAPDVLGCIDTNALNFDSTATIDDGTCTYPPCGGFLTSNAYQNCNPGGQALVIFEWTTEQYNPSCNPVTFWYSTPVNGPYQYGLNPNSTNFAVNAGNGQMPPNWSVEHYGIVEFADGTMSDTIHYTPYSCVEGCMDLTSIAYNPWATIDDGTCTGTTCDPSTEYQISMTVTLDNWPSETAWTMITNTGPGVNTPSGTYTYNDVGQTYTYDFCVSSTLGFELIVNDDFTDGMAGNGTPGNEGEVVIYDCNGDTITYLSSGTWVDETNTGVGVDFGGYPNGNVVYSTPQQGIACAGVVSVPGCIDPAYQEFNPLANVDDLSCTNLNIFGCTDSSAFNYDSTATQLAIESSCNYTLTIEDDGGDGWGNSYLGVSQGNNNWTYTIGPGYYSQSFPITLDTDKPVKVYYFEVQGAQQSTQAMEFQTLHNSFALTNVDGDILLQEGTNPFADNGQGALQTFKAPFWKTYTGIPYCGDLCIPTVYGCMDATAANYDAFANIDTGCITIVYGCMQTLAFNYDPLATVDNNSCIPVVTGCVDSIAYNYDPFANTQGACIYLGCTDEVACNYDSIANLDNGGCVYPIQYLDCDDVCLVDTDGDGVCNELEITGCTDPLSTNFDPLATDDDSTCTPYVYGCTDSTMWNYLITANTDDGSCIEFVYGCTDPLAFNYNVNANTDDGFCEAVIIGCMDNIMWNYDPTANTSSGNCIPFINGCTDGTMWNYDPLANTDNGSCEPFIYGCNDSSALNFDPLANTLDNSCCYIGGCTDSIALNYDPNACYDDNSCITVVVGCTDVSAYNYNPSANVSDSVACLYEAVGCVTGLGEPFGTGYWLNDGCFAWVIDVDDYCCTNEWDASCQSMYDYCQNGWPVALDEVTALGIIVYPNPTRDVITVETRLDVEVQVWDMAGRKLIDTKDTRIDLSKYNAGVYNMIIIYDNRQFSKRVIKQ